MRKTAHNGEEPMAEQTMHALEKRIGLRNRGIVDPLSISDYIKQGGYQGFKKALTMTPEAVIQQVMDSGLRGRGGAGFPTGSKWKYTRAANGPERFAICNADEGEPGTFKDRVLMEEDPHSYLEGLMIAAYAVGASKAFVYIRGEYYTSIQRTRSAIEAARKEKLLGNNILNSGYSLDIHIKLGGGSYLCGEESALIESLEGRRGYPRIKPPYPAEKGVFNKPTAVNNVETLSHVPEIMRHGAAWYRSMGTEKSPGTKIFTICGDIQKPGCYEAEMGIPLEKLLFDMAGGIKGNQTLKAVLVGGAAGTFIPQQFKTIAMDFDSLKANQFTLGSGALIVISNARPMKAILSEILRFFHHESCGKCVPCRVGTRQLQDMAEKGNALPLDAMMTLSQLMFDTSLCPLGQSPIFPVRSAFQHFKPELSGTM